MPRIPIGVFAVLCSAIAALADPAPAPFSPPPRMPPFSPNAIPVPVVVYDANGDVVFGSGSSGVLALPFQRVGKAFALPVSTTPRTYAIVQHFDGDNGHKTLGDVFESLFRGSGKQVIVHPDIAKQALPGGYMLRWNQSAIDFASDVATNYGGTIKAMGDKILVLKRGSGESATGQKLPTTVLRFDENYEYDVELEPRFQFQKTSASYLDTDKGTLEREDKTSGQGDNRDALPHPYPSKDAAAAAAASVAQAWQANAGQGLFTSAGKPEAVSGAPVKCVDFGTPIDETEWLASTVTHDVNPGVGWDTTVETEVQPY